MALLPDIAFPSVVIAMKDIKEEMRKVAGAGGKVLGAYGDHVNWDVRLVPRFGG